MVTHTRDLLVTKLGCREQKTVLEKAQGGGDGKSVKVFEEKTADFVFLDIHGQLENISILGLDKKEKHSFAGLVHGVASY